MPTTVDVLSGPPCEIEAGTTIRFTVGDSDYPNTAWTAVFVMNDGTHAATSIAGTSSATGLGFDYVIPASTTLYPGPYQWAIYYTALSPTTEKARGETGVINVIANLATTATPTFAEAQVTRLQAQLEAMGIDQSRSFNGQSSSDRAMAEVREDIVFWKACVIAEKRRSAGRRGEDVSGTVNTRFGRTSGYLPRSCDCQS